MSIDYGLNSLIDIFLEEKIYLFGEIETIKIAKNAKNYHVLSFKS